MTDAKSPGAVLFEVPAGRPATKVSMLGVAAKLERRRIVERTARGRADAKPKGAKFGRKPTLTLHQQREARGTPRRRRDATQRRPQLQRQQKHYFTADRVNVEGQDKTLYVLLHVLSHVKLIKPFVEF